jgi:hypothetical protein
VAAGRAFQAVEQDDQRLARAAVDKVDIDEIAIRRGPAFAAIGDRRPGCAYGRIDGLQMAAG